MMGGYEPLHLDEVQVEERHRSGRRLHRVELLLDGRVVDATPWCDSPLEAAREVIDLKRRWAQLRRWVPDTGDAA